MNLKQGRQQKVILGQLVDATDLSTPETVAYNAAGISVELYKNAEQGTVAPSNDDRGDRVWSGDHGNTTYGIAVDGSGNVIIGAYVSGGVSIRYFNSAGVEQWNADHGDTVHDVAFDATGNVYIAGLRSGTVTVRCYNDAGVEQWTADTGGDLKTIIVHDETDTVVVGGDPVDGVAIWGLNIADGSVRWTVDEADSVNDLALAPDTNTIYAGAQAGTDDKALLRIMNDEADHYRLLWRKDASAGYPIHGVAVDSEGSVYVADDRGGLYKLSPSGEEIWRDDTLTIDYHGLVVDGNDNIWVCGDRDDSVTHRVYDPDGTLLDFTGDHGAPLTCAAADDDHLYIAGYRGDGDNRHRKISLGNGFWEHVANGNHRLTLAAGDLDETGNLDIRVDADAIRPYQRSLTVYTTENYDAMITGSTLGAAAENVDVAVSTRALDSKIIPAPYSAPEPMVTFSLDDYGMTEEYKAVWDDHGVACTYYVYIELSGKPNLDSADYALIKEWQDDDGWEIGTHSYSHPAFAADGTRDDIDYLTTEADIRDQIERSNEVLRDEGLYIRNFAYPFGYNDARARRICSEYYRSARTTYNSSGLDGRLTHAITTYPFDPFRLSSYSADGIGASAGIRDIVWGFVDDIAARGEGWLILYMHPSNIDADQLTRTDELMTYIEAAGIPMVTVDEALDRIGERPGTKEIWEHDLADHEATAATGSRVGDMMAAVRAWGAGELVVTESSIRVYGTDGSLIGEMSVDDPNDVAHRGTLS